jgi:hypothetical protein
MRRRKMRGVAGEGEEERKGGVTLLFQ